MSKKKKIMLLTSLFVIVLLLFIFLWSMCAGMISNAKYDLKVSISEADAEGVSGEIQCTDSYDSYGLGSYRLEKKTLLGWKPMKPVRNIATNLLSGNGKPISEGKIYNFKFDLVRNYGELGSGIYRFKWNIDKYDGTELVEEVDYCYATFVIWN